MQKVYLLLRNNKQEGPYTLEELINVGYKTTDLIWVEGKSAAWRYPSEINELKSYLQDFTPENIIKSEQEISFPLNSKTSKNKKVFVSLPDQSSAKKATTDLKPSDVLEQKAEALRQRSQAYTPAAKKAIAQDIVETKYSRSLNDVEEDYTKWQLRQNKKKPSFLKRKNLIGAFVLAIIASIAIYFLQKPADIADIQTPQIISKKDVESNDRFKEKVTDDYLMETTSTPVNEISITSKTAHTKAPQKEIREKKIDDSTPQLTAENNVVVAANDNSLNEAGENLESENKPEPAAQKKKSIGEAIDGFFGKFRSKKQEEAKREMNTEPDESGVRKSTRRGDAADKAIKPDAAQLAQQVKVSVNEPAENWMLGIKGLKLTLHNESDFKLSKAAVEVTYFDEQNSLLENKTVVFQNVPANKKVTLAAPDHRLASYARHNLISVSGE